MSKTSFLKFQVYRNKGQACEVTGRFGVPILDHSKNEKLAFTYPFI